MSQVILATPLDALGPGRSQRRHRQDLHAGGPVRARGDRRATRGAGGARGHLHHPRDPGAARARARPLLRAAELAAHWRDGDPARAAGDDAGTALLRQLHPRRARRRHANRCRRCARRLARAAREMDQAAITTIHGFCQRVLGEHALDTGQVLRAAEVVTNVREAREAIAVELWREWNARADDNAWLRRHYPRPVRARRCAGRPDGAGTAAAGTAIGRARATRDARLDAPACDVPRSTARRALQQIEDATAAQVLERREGSKRSMSPPCATGSRAQGATPPLQPLRNWRS